MSLNKTIEPKIKLFITHIMKVKQEKFNNSTLGNERIAQEWQSSFTETFLDKFLWDNTRENDCYQNTGISVSSFNINYLSELSWVCQSFW